MPPVANAFPSPSAWSQNNSRAEVQELLDFDDGNKVTYRGPGIDDSDAVTVRANHPVPRNAGIYYFEVDIVDKGREGFIGVGFCGAGVNMARLPGWENHSYGYHGDDGHRFESDGRGTAYGPVFTTGDVVGCVLNFTDRTISFTKNGTELGVAFENVREEVLYPCVGVRTPGESIRANFSGPFKADFNEMKAEAVRKVVSGIANVPVPAAKLPRILNSLVLSHLQHMGYSESAAAVARDMAGEGAGLGAGGAPLVGEEDERDMRERAAVQALLVGGRIDEAMAAAEGYCPGVLAARPRVLLHLQCQKLVEMVRAGDDAATMDFMGTLSQHRGGGAEGGEAAADRDTLQDACSLLAYKDPETSPVAYMLQLSRREDVAAMLNAALLEGKGRRPGSALEAVYKQAVVAHGVLQDLGCGAASLVDVDKDIFRGVEG